MLSISAGPLVFTPLRLIFLISFGVALLVGWLYGLRTRVSVEPALTRMLLWGLVAARLSFVLVYFDDYWRKPWQIIDIRDGGFFYLAGIAAAVLAGAYHAWKHPQIRKALGVAAGSGFLVWSISVGIFNAVRLKQLTAGQLPLMTLAGDSLTLDGFHGRPLVVNLWATWCPPCRREMPVLAEAQQREKGIEFIFVNQQETADSVSRFLNEAQLTLRNVFLDPQGEWSSQVGADAMPTTLFFDEEGVLVGSHTGELSTASLKHAMKHFQ